MKPLTWAGCYDEGWKGVITPEAFAHPAKFSRGLIKRILDHMLARGYIQRGDTIGDPFGGIGTGGIEAVYRGLRWVGVELEEKFVGLAGQNFGLHRGKWDTLGLPRPVIVQGDSRRFDVAVQGVVTSPPYAMISPEKSSTGVDMRKNWEAHRASGGGSSFEAYCAQQKKHSAGYGSSSGQISALKEGALSAVVSSPPYGTREDGGGIAATGDTSESRGGTQLGRSTLAAVVASPPYSDISAGAGGLNTKPAKRHGQQSGRKNGASQDTDQRYGDDPAQIAKLRESGGVDSVVTSPPWEKNSEGALKASKFKTPEHALQAKRGHGASDAARLAQLERDEHNTYGESDGQIGREAGETYWQAMLLVYSACYRSIKPGGYIAVGVKDYVKNKARVPLCDDTLRLLTHVGFTPVERIHAMLVEETTHAQLFGADHVTRKERKSFFRRLAEKKGSPPIDYEEVLICRRPLLTPSVTKSRNYVRREEA